MACVLLGALWWGGPAGAKASTATGTETELAALGEGVCAGYDNYCRLVWSAGLAAHAPFNLLISEACHHVRVFEADPLAGIRCLLAGIEGVTALGTAALTQGHPAFAPGEARPTAQPPVDWPRQVRVHFAGIAAHCDQVTPVIHHYYGCLREGVLFYSALLGKWRMS